MKNKLVHRFVIGTFVSLYLLVSVISTIHVIEFFELSNPHWLAVALAVAFELGAAASLASLIILDKMNKGLVWTLFAVITLMQMQGNMYYAFVNMKDFQGWSELFGIVEEEIIYQRRVLAAVSGAILPLVALGFIKSLVDYIKPESNQDNLEAESDPTEGKSKEILDDQPEVTKESNPVAEEAVKEIWEDVTAPSIPEPIIEEKKDEKMETMETEGEPSVVLPDQEVAEEIQEEAVEEIQEDLNSPLQDEEVEAILSETSSTNSNVVPGYYGDIVIDGNGVTTQESEILPVNSNKPQGMVDSSSKVYISPTRL